MQRWWALAILTALMVGYGPARGQAVPSAAQRPTFRGSIDVVAVNVTVTDGARHYVTDLGPRDFRIFEDGRPQELTFFQKTGFPLALTLLLDTSASMDQNLPLAQEAAIGFVHGLSPADVASVIDFDNRVQLRQEFTTERRTLERAIREMAAGGSTSLYNAVYIALKELNKTARDEGKAQPRRRAIVLLSDGEDTSSLVTFDEVLDLAARSDTTIYAIGLYRGEAPNSKRSEDGPFVLRRLAQQTGGRAFFPLHAKALAGIYSEIRAELSSQYSLAYESNNPKRDGLYHRIDVRVGRTGAVARARHGYYAPRK